MYRVRGSRIAAVYTCILCPRIILYRFGRGKLAHDFVTTIYIVIITLYAFRHRRRALPADHCDATRSRISTCYHCYSYATCVSVLGGTHTMHTDHGRLMSSYRVGIGRLYAVAPALLQNNIYYHYAAVVVSSEDCNTELKIFKRANPPRAGRVRAISVSDVPDATLQQPRLGARDIYRLVQLCTILYRLQVRLVSYYYTHVYLGI